MLKGIAQKIHKRLDVSKLKEQSKNEEVGELLRQCVPTSRTTWEETCNSLRNIAKEQIGYKQKVDRKVWISDNTWKLIQERNNLKQQKLENPNLTTRYEATAKAVKKSARSDKRKHFENLTCEAEVAAGSNSIRELYNIIGRITNQNMNRKTILKDKNGQLLTNVDEQTRRWRDHFESISNFTEENNITVNNTSSETTTIINTSISDTPPDIEEISTAISKLKRNKAPGEDGIPPELLQTNPFTSAEILIPYIYNAWINEELPNTWTKGVIIKLPKKNDLTVCDNWRGITLLNTIYKIIAIIINTRLAGVEQTLRDEQAGFRPHRNCVDQTNTLRVIIEQSVEWRTPLYLVFIDFKKAFDSIRRSAIWEALRAKGVPSKIINMIKTMYNNTTLYVRHNGRTSEPFTTNAGVKQGCPLSPLLFAVVLDEIMKKLTTKKKRKCMDLQ